GMPLYQAQPPTGYIDAADTWVNTGSLLNRMNFALGLVQNRVQGVRVNLSDTAGASGSSVDDARNRLVGTLLPGSASDATLATLKKATDVPRLTALVLGAPEFQRK